MKPRELPPPALAHLGWSSDEINILSDMLRDGFTCASIGLCLGRSKKAVQDMAQRCGIPVKRRGETIQTQIHVRAEEHAVLTRYATARGLTTTTFCRIVLELAARCPIWIDQLLDDDRHIESDAAEPAMDLTVKQAPVVEPREFTTELLIKPVATPQPMLSGHVEFTLTMGS